VGTQAVAISNENDAPTAAAQPGVKRSAAVLGLSSRTALGDVNTNVAVCARPATPTFSTPWLTGVGPRAPFFFVGGAGDQPTAKAQKTTAASVASALVAPTAAAPALRPLAASGVSLVVAGYKMPVLSIAEPVPRTQQLNDAHLQAVARLGIEDIHREDDQDAQEAKEYVIPSVEYMMQIEVRTAPTPSPLMMNEGACGGSS
jgi:hypothetical protein